MNLLGELKIRHAVLHDLDAGKTGKAKVLQDGLNQLILDSQNQYTLAIDTMPNNLETFLGIVCNDQDRWKKAAKVLLDVQKGAVDAAKLKAFKEKIEKLLSIFS